MALVDFDSSPDYSSMTSDDYSSQQLSSSSSLIDYEHEITAHLTVNSLILLGFNTDEYLSIYSGIAFDVTPVTPKTFDKPNEKMLLIVLHYLLCILDREEFLLSIEKCWPFLDNKERSLFKKACHIALIRLIERGVLPNAMYQGNLQPSSSAEIWTLLHFLTDRAMDLMLQGFKFSQFGEQINALEDDRPDGGGQETIRSPLQFNSSAVSSSSSSSASSVAPYHDASHPVIAGAGLPAAISHHHVHKDSLLQEIDERVQQVKSLILNFNAEKSEWNAYLEELDKRLIEAKKTIKNTEQKLREIQLQDEFNIFAEQGKTKRAKLLARITAQKDLLHSFLSSPLLGDVDKYLKEERQLDESQKAALATAMTNNNLNNNSNGSNSNGTRRKMLSKEEMEAYKISMRDAISTLVQKIEEVGTLV